MSNEAFAHMLASHRRHDEITFDEITFDEINSAWGDCMICAQDIERMRAALSDVAIVVAETRLSAALWP
jgi:hypothetical protein